MLYTLHEMQQAAMRPLHAWAETSREMFSHPFSPLTHLPNSEHVVAGAELLARMVRRYEKPVFGLDSTVIDGQDVPVRIAYIQRDPFCNLLQFVRTTAKPNKDPKVLLVAPLSGHHATLLRDTVRALLPNHDVYITDWIDARQVPLTDGDFHFADYVTYVQRYLRLLGPDVHVISVCQPTVPVLAAISLMAADNDPAQPKSMVMMGGPIDSRANPTEVNHFAQAHSLRWFEMKLITRVPNRYPGYLRRVYPGFLQQAGFVSMNPDKHLKAHMDFYQHLVEGDGDSADSHRKFYDEYNAVMDMDADYYLETLDQVFHRHLLPRGEMVINGQAVKPEAITKTALMTVEGALDDISAPGQTVAAHTLCAGLPAKKKETLLVPGVGHYGIFSGRRWREQVAPKISDFIRKHD